MALGIEAEREEEIRAELAGHLEDAYVDAIRRGCMHRLRRLATASVTAWNGASWLLSLAWQVPCQ